MATEGLLRGVEGALSFLGSALLRHPDNSKLRDGLIEEDLHPTEYYHQLLVLAFRLLVLIVAQERGLLPDPRCTPGARRRYLEQYSVLGLLRLAGQDAEPPRGAGLWCRLVELGQRLVRGSPGLGLPALGGLLWSEDAAPGLAGARLSDTDLLCVIRALGPDSPSGLSPEELGTIYESMLELQPRVDLPEARFELGCLPGHARRTTGSYYTPSSLVQQLLDTALEPVMEDRLRQAKGLLAKQALLSLRICDPACGTGHFLLAAGRRMAHRLAGLREQNPGAKALRAALGEVSRLCLYGVDSNPVAVELCKLGLWLQAGEPGGLPDSLHAHIRHGDALLGATPALMKRGIPDDAFQPIEGDDPEVAMALRRRNRQERTGQGSLLLQLERIPRAGSAAPRGEADRKGVEPQPPGPRQAGERFLADAWTAAFVWPKTADSQAAAITEDAWQGLRHGRAAAAPASLELVQDLAARHAFFHWHLAFPEVLAVAGTSGDRGGDGDGDGDGRGGRKGDGDGDGKGGGKGGGKGDGKGGGKGGRKGRDRNRPGSCGWVGGFDVVVGNPPWEMLQVQDLEIFAGHQELGRHRTRAGRQRAIDELCRQAPRLHRRYREQVRRMEGLRHFLSRSGRFELSTRGRINTYKVFLELGWALLSRSGRLGMVVPSGIAFDDSSAGFFSRMVESRALESLYDFENRARFFPAVDRRYRFCLLTLSGLGRPHPGGARFVFYARELGELDDPARSFLLDEQDLELLNPETRTCPTFRSQRDAELCKELHRRHPLFVRAQGGSRHGLWGVRFGRVFNLGHEGDEFSCVESEPGGIPQRGLSLYEGKMFSAYNHRAASVRFVPENATRPFQSLPSRSCQLEDPSFVVRSQLWLDREVLEPRMKPRWSQPWLIAAKDVTSATNERTLIAAILPWAPTSLSVRIILGQTLSGLEASCLLGMLNSFALDWLIRQFLGGLHLQDSITRQAPALAPELFTRGLAWCPEEPVGAWIQRRVLELSYTAWDLQAFARSCGWQGGPFGWDEERRGLLRCELDAAYLQLYGIEGNDAEHILDSFPIVRRKELERHGEDRRKRLILEVQERMRQAAAVGRAYQSLLDPRPADPRLCHETGPPAWLVSE